MNLSEFGLAPPIPGSWWLHAALHASWPWHTALGDVTMVTDEKSNEIEWRFHILPYSSIFYLLTSTMSCFAPSSAKVFSLSFVTVKSCLAHVLREYKCRTRNVNLCKLGSVLHSQLEVVKEEPSTGQNCFGMQIWTGRARDSEGMWLLSICHELCTRLTSAREHVHTIRINTRHAVAAWRPAKLETPWVCWAAQGSESSAANPNRCQQPDKIWQVHTRTWMALHLITSNYI